MNVRKKSKMSEKMSEIHNANFTLPESWRWVRLGEACSIYPGQHILESDYNRGRVGVGYLTGPADFGETYPSVTKWTERPKAWCEPGDVLVTVKGAGVGKSNLAPNEQVAIGRQLMAIRPKPELMEQRFLYYVVIIHFSKLQAKSVGSTVPGLGRKDIETLEISLPPFHEQKRIAAKIQELMQEVERARTACEKQLDAAKALPAAYLRGVFESEEAKKWERKKLGEVCEVVTGNTPSRNFPENYGAYIPWIKPEDLDREMYVSYSKEYLSELGVTRSRALPAGAVLVSCIGNLGKTAIAGCKLATNQQINSLIPSPQINSEYLYFCCHTLQEALEILASSTTLKIVNKRIFASIEIPLPPLSVQQRIAAELKEKMAQIKKLRTSIEKQLEALDALPQTILRKAFIGEL